jgi:tetratricopeptide (TPR) repeat protein
LVAPHLADAYLRDGNLAAARDLLEEREQASSRGSAWFHNAAYRRRLAEVALATDDAAQGRAWLLPAIQRLRDTGSENELAISLRVLGEAERRLGNELTARGHFEEALDIFHRLGTPGEPELIHALLSR